MNVNFNPICINVSTKLFIERKWYMKKNPSLFNRNSNVGNGNHSLRCMKKNEIILQSPHSR